MNTDSSPIAAIATAPGRGGVGIIRISGKNLEPFISEFFKAATTELPLKPRYAYFLPFLDENSNIIDEGIALYFKGPNSFTGEDVLELQGHGGPVVLQMLLKRCLQAGKNIDLRIAEPGEFTRRAFLNDRIDLAQAEAIADLIDATTEEAVRSASRSLSGAFSREIHELVSSIIQVRMLVESSLDFPEEDIDFLQKENVKEKITSIRKALKGIIAQATQGALLREGIHVVLAGQTNVGKSSLLNVLTGSDIAIVTPIAGTTRDKIMETIQLEGIPVTLIDTAGIRTNTAEDEVERIGIERTWNEIGKADVILHLLDASLGPTRSDEKIAADFPENIPVIQIWNKIDISGHRPSVDNMFGITQIYLSTQTGQGIDLLKTELLKIAGWVQTGESTYLARERHMNAMKTADKHLAIATEHAQSGSPSLDLMAEELRLAQDALNSITGEFTSDDLLGLIFSRFCIGK